MKTIQSLLQKRAEKQYKKLLEEGYDVVLPPEPLIPVTQRFAAQSGGNYPIEKAQVKHFVDNVIGKFGIRQKVFVIVVDTGAKSLNKYIQRNFQDSGLDHTGDNQPIDQNGHFSFCGSQVLGLYDGSPLGALAYPGLPADFWGWSGEKVLKASGGGTFPGIESGLLHALQIADEKKAQGYRVIISCSWGGFGNHNGVREAVNAFRDKGHFPFFAAGNSGEQGVIFPANIEADEKGEVCFAIGAVDSNDNVAGFSSRGAELDFMSYGVSNLGAGPGVNDIRQGSGTSYATPFAAGCAGLILATFPEVENMADLEYVLKNGITEAGPDGWDKDYGHGIIKMNQYAEDDLPGGEDPDEPDEPGDPEQPELMPERVISIRVRGEYGLVWDTLPQQKSKKQPMGPDISELAVDGAISVVHNNPSATAYEWKKINFSGMQVDVRTRLAGDVAAKLLEDYMFSYFRNRGLLLSPPADFVSAGQYGLFFAKFLGNRDHQLGIESITAVVSTEEGFQAHVRNIER